ncbi:MAG: K+/H+ antiporter subunit F [Rhodobacteraceae bacterium]|jgi:multicomponent K+:H+ antiporter subunit F|nr:K+/H+ antiporter subunit F [Paracoccaceae bacterium]
MITYAFWFANACFGGGLLCNLLQFIRARDVIDRVQAFDTMVINAIALLILFGTMNATGHYFEASLLFAMVGFVSTVAFCKFLLRGDIIE